MFQEPEGPRIQEATSASDEEILSILEPEVQAWFTSRFDAFTPPQRYAVKELHDRHNVLISSPTGSGKTLSAFLAAINELVHEAKQGTLEDRVYVVYVSPLKALNNDIEHNLKGPLEGIMDELETTLGERPEIRVGVRTGDTTQYERAKMTETPPHIFITTPESLAIVLNAPKFSQHFSQAGWIIVDEVHALAENKRGTHLMLALERLCDRTPNEPTRIGLSATVHPLEEVAGFLVGRGSHGRHRPCRVVDVTYEQEIDIDVLCPVDDLLSAPAEEVTEELYGALDELIEDHRTTLIFTNTRAGTERVVHHLQDRFGDRYEDLVGAHHGSMSKEKRLDIEQRLKDGELKAVVTSTSLELGIDIGHIDLVVLLSSPRGVARALQRIGRAGHRLGEVSKGVLIALDRDDLIECTVIAEAARRGALDPLEIPDGGLDVLCQHLVGMSLERVWDVEEAHARVRRAEPYHALAMGDLVACLEYLAGPEDLEGHNVYGKLWYDPGKRAFGRRGSKTRPIYYTNIGTIPDTTQLQVKQGDDVVGTVDEEFVEGLSKGDVFVLGGQAWEYRGASPVKARVSSASSRRPTVPRWFAEQLPMSHELAQRVAEFRYETGWILETEGRRAALEHLQSAYHLDARAAGIVTSILDQQARFAGIPAPDEALVEEHTDETGATKLVFHAPIGRPGCEGLARAFAHRTGRLKGEDVAWMVNDYGFVLTIPSGRKLTDEEVRGLFMIDLARELHEAIDDAELLRRRFRHVAARALMILRNYLGTNISVGRQNASARKLLRHLQRTRPDSPILTETYREILHDALGYQHAQAFLFRFVSRRSRVRFERGLPGPSPLAFNLVAATSAAAVLGEQRHELLERFQAQVEQRLSPPEILG